MEKRALTLTVSSIADLASQLQRSIEGARLLGIHPVTEEKNEDGTTDVTIEVEVQGDRVVQYLDMLKALADKNQLRLRNALWRK